MTPAPRFFSYRPGNIRKRVKNAMLLIIPYIFACLCFIVVAVQSLRRFLKTRKRFALMRLNPHDIPLYAEQPLRLVLKPSTLIRKLSLKWFLIFFAAWVGTVAIFLSIFLVIGLLTVAKFTSIPSSDVLSFMAILFGGFSVFGVILNAIITLALYQRIEANEGGLTVQRGIIRRHISWNQAQLFAVDHEKDDKGKIASHWDELSGEHKVVRWEYTPEIPRRTALKFTPAEYPQELACLRSYIHAKTGLPLRDLRSFRD